jgi:hypothetical protein
MNDEHVTRSLAEEGAAERGADEVRCQSRVPADDDHVRTHGCSRRKYLRGGITGSTDEIGGDLPTREKTLGRWGGLDRSGARERDARARTRRKPRLPMAPG